MPKIIERKLNDEQRTNIIRMYAEGVAPTECSVWVKENWGIDYKPASITALVRTVSAKPLLDRFREDYLRRVKEVPIANKRIRVEDLEYVRVKLMKLIKENECISKTQKEEFRHQVKTLNELILNAREEMEKKPFIAIGLGDFSDKTDDQLIAERDEILKQAERLAFGGVIEVSSSPAGIEDKSQSESA